MPTPASLRDSTQIVLPATALEGVRGELERKFTLTVLEPDEGHVRIVGSPVEISAASDFLARRGVRLP